MRSVALYLLRETELEKKRSQIALDWVNFFLADVETGVGPFMAGYFTAIRHWNPEQIGMVIAAQKFTSVAAQVFAGWLIDRSSHKNSAMSATAFAISVSCVLVVWAPGVLGQMANQAAVGIWTALATLLIGAISLGVVGRDGLPGRVGRNGAFSHAGNMVTATLGGYLGFRVGQQWIFYVSGALGIACTIAALLIRSSDIDDKVAREAPETKDSTREAQQSVGELLWERRVLIFAASVLLFHIANSAMLPLATERISAVKHTTAPIYITLCIVLPQLVMIPVAPFTGRAAANLGRKPVFLLAFGALSLRGFLFALSDDPNYLVGVELLDGVGTGIAGVATVLVIADLARGTGRFNALTGIMQAALGSGAFLGNLGAGALAKRIGFAPVFVGLAALALGGLLLFWTAMPETADRKQQVSTA